MQSSFWSVANNLKEISADDEEAMRLFMGSKPDLEPQSTVTLADIIMEKIRQKEMETELQVREIRLVFR